MKLLFTAVLFASKLAADNAGGLCNTWNPPDTYPIQVGPTRVLCAKISLDFLSRTTGVQIAPGFPDQVQVWIWTDDSEAAAFSVDIRYEIPQDDGSTKEITKEAIVRRLKRPEGQTEGMAGFAQVSLETPADLVKVLAVRVEPLARRSDPAVMESRTVTSRAPRVQR